MVSTPRICKTRVTLRKQELDAVQTKLQAYLDFHCVQLYPHTKRVREALLPAINTGLDEYMPGLANKPAPCAANTTILHLATRGAPFCTRRKTLLL